MSLPRPLVAALAAALILPAAAVSAQPLHQTHEEVRMPAGKTVKLYRPLNRDDCRVAARHHQAGKMQWHATAASGCPETAAVRKPEQQASR